ncbi:MAG: 30S ribosomal protein S6 [Chitinophagales bacterium]
MVRNYELVVVITPVLKDAEQKELANAYVELLTTYGAEIVEKDFWGLKQLAYPIKKKTTGVYMVVEYIADTEIVAKMELQLKRDERVLRFLTTRLDKYAKEYNEKKRQGLVGRNRKKRPDEKRSEDKKVENN